jgi:hypothetical protein
MKGPIVERTGFVIQLVCLACRQRGYRRAAHRCPFLQESFPNGVPCGERQRIVFEGYDDYALDGIINIPYSVCGKKHHALIILQFMQENRDPAVHGMARERS